MKHFLAIVYMGFLLWFFPAKAQDSVLTLHGLLQKIEQEYPEILQYNSKVEALKYRAKGAKSWMPPTVSFGMDRFPYNPMMLNEESLMNQAGLMFSVEQMFPNASKLNAQSNYYLALTKVEEANQAWTKNSLRLQARLLYYRQYTALRQLAIIAKNESVLKLFIESAEIRYVHNQGELGTVFKAKARLAELQNMKTMLNATLAESRIGMNILLGKPYTDSVKIDTSANSVALQTFPDTTISNRSDIQSMSLMIKAMEEERKLMSLGRKPEFGVRFNHMQMFGMPNQYSLMGMMTIPIVPWSSGMYKNDVRAMNSEIESTEYRRENMLRMATQMSQEKTAMHYYQKLQFENYNRNIIPAYKNNLEATMLSWKQNTSTFFVLLDSWEMLLMKQMEAENQLQELLKLQAELLYEFEK